MAKRNEELEQRVHDRMREEIEPDAAWWVQRRRVDTIVAEERDG